MLLAVDIGNTNVDLGLFAGAELVRQHKVPVDAHATPDSCAALLRDFLPAGGPLEGAAIGSVVRGLGAVFAAACPPPALQVEGSWDLGLKIDYDHPDRIGIDRLAAAAAAFAATPTGHAAVVADCGTAITVDAVDAGGVFRGGAIAPGLRLQLRALRSGTSLLPEVELQAGAELLGRDTAACMRSGAVHGSAALVDGLCQRIAERLGEPVRAVLTGGDGPLLHPHTRSYPCLDPALVLRGLALAFRRRARA